MTVPNASDDYLVLGSKPWCRRVFDEVLCRYPGRWHFVGTPEEFTPEAVARVTPRYIFSLHWSWWIPEGIVEEYECVCFHMADVPYGRGGSPLQNLIIRGHRRTKLTALRMTAEFDAGPVYFKEDLSLDGNAEEIYIRACRLSAQMIRRIIDENPLPVAQAGTPVVFPRRKPDESEIPRVDSLHALYDFIRMLDAEGYPRAFVDHHGFRYEFSRAALYDGRIVADVTIRPVEEAES
jgi:methionyl-tRNA formyltransferase